MEFETEEQQAEAVKKWFKEYGLTIVLGLVIGMGGVYGYRYYETEKEAGFEQASVAYADAMASIADKTAFDGKVAQYKTEYGNNVYSNLLGFHQAKMAVDSNDLAAAESVLADVMANAGHEVVEHTARIRLARVQIGQEKYEEALTTIAGAKGDAYNYSYELLRGDIWLARGDQQKAKDAFAKAQELSGQGPSHPDLAVLLAELSSVSEPSASMSGDANE